MKKWRSPLLGWNSVAGATLMNFTEPDDWVKGLRSQKISKGESLDRYQDNFLKSGILVK